MADANGRNIGDPGYDKTTDPNQNPFYVSPANNPFPQTGTTNIPPPDTTGGTSAAGTSGTPGYSDAFLAALNKPGAPQPGTPAFNALLAGLGGNFGYQQGQDGYPSYNPTNGTIGIAGGYLANVNGVWNFQPRGDETGGGSSIPSVDPYTLPSGSPNQYVTPAPFTAPTLQDLLTSPGFQAGSDLLTQQQQRSAAAKGSILSGGFQAALAKAQTNYATNSYGNLYNQALSGYQTNAGTSLAGSQQDQAQYQDAVANTLSQYQQRYNAYQGAITNQFNLANLGRPVPPSGIAATA